MTKNTRYSFLKDEIALEEIRKHKWIESEKYGREIGSATAALDWIKNHGEQWLRSRDARVAAADIFAERRTYRRFPRRIPVRLKVDDTYISSCTNEINFLGFSCASSQYIPEHTPIEITLDLEDRVSARRKVNLRFESRVRRVSPSEKQAQNECHEIFLPFDDQIKNYLRQNIDILTGACS